MRRRLCTITLRLPAPLIAMLRRLYELECIDEQADRSTPAREVAQALIARVARKP